MTSCLKRHSKNLLLRFATGSPSESLESVGPI
jgi:hypothetical protein